MILARAEDPAFRAAWRKRIEDHDGEDGWSGGIARWLHLATSLGLDAEAVKSERLALPATRFAVGAYLSFCTNRTLLEAVASSLTELFSPVIIGERVPAMLARYDYVTEDTLSYFTQRPEQASRDSDFALAYVLEHADTPRAPAGRRSMRWCSNAISCGRCSTRCSMPMARAENIPPGAFRPETLDDRAARTGTGLAAVGAVAAEACAHPVRSGAAGLCRAFAGKGVLAERHQPRHSAPLRRTDHGRRNRRRHWRPSMTPTQKTWRPTSSAFLQEWSDKLLVTL